MMDHGKNGSTNGFLTRERFEALTTFSCELAGLGTVRYRKIGRAEYEALWPLLPAAADEWPTLPPMPEPGDPQHAELLAARETVRLARREAEATWLRAQPDADQVRWRSRANDIAFRVIAACVKTPALSVDDARQLGDAAEVLYVEILTKSGLIEAETPPAPPPAVAVEAAADAA